MNTKNKNQDNLIASTLSYTFNLKFDKDRIKVNKHVNKFAYQFLKLYKFFYCFSFRFRILNIVS